MPNKLVAIRMPKKLIEEANAAAEKYNYASTQEFIRECIRRAVHERRRTTEEALAEIGKLYGASRNNKVKRMTPQERDALAREFTKNL